jgi:hypothetical protein
MLLAVLAVSSPARSQSSSTSVSGWAWSDTIGWVALNCLTPGADPSGCSTHGDWGLVADSSGNLSGYAWSDQVGWIQAGPTSCGTQANISGGLTGWLRAYTDTLQDGDFSTNPSGTWTLGSGWSWDSAGRTMRHAPTASVALSQRLNVSNIYSISFDMTGALTNAGSLGVSVGSNPTFGSVGVGQCANGTTCANVTFTLPDNETTGNTINIVPTANFDGTIDNVRINGRPIGEGWDGCISLSGTSPTYQVTTASNSSYVPEISGAWGSDIIGWLGFNLNAPTVATLAATFVGSTEATLNGQANPSGVTTTGWFRFSATDPGSCNDTFGTRVPSSGGTSLGSGSSLVPYSVTASSFSQTTTYYYCAIANNGTVTTFGGIQSFTTVADICTDIAGTQSSVPTGCLTPSPSPGACTDASHVWNGSQCTGAIPSGCVSGSSSCAPALHSLRIKPGATTSLYVSVSNVQTSCVLTGTGGNTQSWTFTPTSGTVQTTVGTNPISQSSTFTLSCDAGSFVDRAVVNVLPEFREI